MQRTKATVSEPAIYLAMLLALCPSGGFLLQQLLECERMQTLREFKNYIQFERVYEKYG
jgi:hypothetical protein